MTKKHFKEFAENFRIMKNRIEATKKEIETATAPEAEKKVIESLYVKGMQETFDFLLEETMCIFKRDNSSFDRDRFLAAVSPPEKPSKRTKKQGVN